MTVPLSLDPELGRKISKVCPCCKKLLMREMTVGATTIQMCRDETHYAILIQHPKGETPSVFTRAGLRDIDDREKVADMVLGIEEGGHEDLVCPMGCGFTTDSPAAYERHLAFCGDR